MVAGPWYTVVGPMTQTAATGNSELFINVGPPGTRSPLARLYANGDQSIVYYPEFLLLVNGADDNANGWTDEGWDGVDNNGDGNIDELAEWESELWTGAALTQNITNLPYLIRRRPAPVVNARRRGIPHKRRGGSHHLEHHARAVPASGEHEYGICGDPGQSRRHGRPIDTVLDTVIVRPVVRIFSLLAGRTKRSGRTEHVGDGGPLFAAAAGAAPNLFNGLELKGEYSLITLFTRTGQITTNANPPFDNPAAPTTGKTYNPNLPFLSAQLGTSGD